MNLKDSALCSWLLTKQRNEIPLLGICFGLQLLNVNNGGSVGDNDSGLIIGTQTTILTDVFIEYLKDTMDIPCDH